MMAIHQQGIKCVIVYITILYEDEILKNTITYSAPAIMFIYLYEAILNIMTIYIDHSLGWVSNVFCVD